MTYLCCKYSFKVLLNEGVCVYICIYYILFYIMFYKLHIYLVNIILFHIIYYAL